MDIKVKPDSFAISRSQKLGYEWLKKGLIVLIYDMKEGLGGVAHISKLSRAKNLVMELITKMLQDGAHEESMVAVILSGKHGKFSKVPGALEELMCFLCEQGIDVPRTDSENCTKSVLLNVEKAQVEYMHKGLDKKNVISLLVRSKE